MNKTKAISITAAFTAVAVGGAAWVMSGNSNRPVPTTALTGTTAPHMDNNKRNIARDDVVTAFDQMGPRLIALQDMARRTGTLDAYSTMARTVNQAYGITRVLGNKDGTIAGMPATDRVNILRDIEAGVRTFFSIAQTRPGFAETLVDPTDNTKPSEAGKIYKEWPGYSAKIDLALGKQPMDLAKTERTTTANPLTKQLIAILPTAGPDGTIKYSLPVQMLQGIAFEIQKSGGGYYAKAVDGIGKLMASPAPNNPLGGSDLYHALDYSQKWLALDANMRAEGARFDLAVANIQPNYSVNIKTTLNRARTDVQESCTKIAAKLKADHGYRGDSKCDFTLR